MNNKDKINLAEWMHLRIKQLGDKILIVDNVGPWGAMYRGFKPDECHKQFVEVWKKLNQEQKIKII